MATRHVSLTEATDERLRQLPRTEVPNVSAFIEKLLVRELDRRDAVAARRAEKAKA